MTAYAGQESTLGKIVKWVVIGFLAILALKIGTVVVGAAVRLGFVLLFTLGPLLLIGWLVLKFLRYLGKQPSSTY